MEEIEVYDVSLRKDSVYYKKSNYSEQYREIKKYSNDQYFEKIKY
jgi:hypothetical protein